VRRPGAIAGLACACIGLPTGVISSQGPLDPLSSAVWRVAGEGRGSPAADASTAYFLGRRNEVIAVNARSGAVRWRTPTGRTGDTTLGFRVVAAGSVVVAGDYHLVAMDAASGAVRWRFDPEISPKDGGYAPGPYLGSAGVGLVFTGAGGGRMYALEQDTGRVRWSIPVAAADATVFEPIAVGGVVAATFTRFTNPNSGGVILVDAQTGAVRWRTMFIAANGPPAHLNAAGGPVLTDTLVIAASGDGAIHGFDRGTGAERWRIPPLDAMGRIGFTSDARPLAIAGRTLYAGSLTGTVAAYDVPTQRTRWEYRGNSGSVAFKLAIDDQTVYVPHVGGRLVALAAGTGTERWRIGDLRAGFTAPPIGFGSLLYFAGEGAGFWAIPR
jgi:outer membrane protein assembly factor BamB